MMYKIFYKISKKGHDCGYLYGTFHQNLNPLDYENKKTFLEPFLQECKEIFLEVELPHFTGLTLGVERAILEVCNGLDKSSDVRSLGETIAFHVALINTRIWIGSRIKQMPWHRYLLLKNYSRLFHFCNKIVIFFATIYNTLYNSFSLGAHTNAVQKYANEQQQILVTLFEAYQNGNASIPSPQDREYYFLDERNQAYAEIIDAQRLGKKNFYAVGMLHLAGEKGLVEQLKARGYELESISIV